jgi:hypothetical protein
MREGALQQRWRMRGVNSGAEEKSMTAIEAAQGPDAPACPTRARVGARNPEPAGPGAMARDAGRAGWGRGSGDDIRSSVT